MTFAQALARIEELLKTEPEFLEWKELEDLLLDHADSIVQLGKVAAEMRESFNPFCPFTPGDGHETILIKAIDIDDVKLSQAGQDFDKLMDGGG